MILGHAHPAVVAAVREQLEHGTTYFMLNEPIIKLADELCRAVPCAEQVRFTSTGTEATFFALRAARAWRKREKVMKFEGGYHGSHDYALMSSAPKSPKAFPAATPGLGGHSARPHRRGAGRAVQRPGHRGGLARGSRRLAGRRHRRAVPARSWRRSRAFSRACAPPTSRYQIPLIFDEVVTGFRFAYGGAQEYYGVVPDLAALGKIIGGGFPLAAVCGREDIMKAFDPRLDGTPDFVAQVGTLNGNPIAAVAGLATLAELRKPGAYARLHGTGRKLRDGLADLVKRSGLPRR